MWLVLQSVVKVMIFTLYIVQQSYVAGVTRCCEGDDIYTIQVSTILQQSYVAGVTRCCEGDDIYAVLVFSFAITYSKADPRLSTPPS